MEKTKEQKLTAKERFLAQRDRAIKMLDTEDLDAYIDGLKYAYSLSMRYRSINLRDFIDGNSIFENPFGEVADTPKQKCIKAGILKPWRDTYWFDKEKAASLQLYIQEHTNDDDTQ